MNLTGQKELEPFAGGLGDGWKGGSRVTMRLKGSGADLTTHKMTCC